MTLLPARAALGAIALAALEFVPIDVSPPVVLKLGAGDEVEAYALAPESSTAVVSIASTGEPKVSALRYAKGEDEPRSVPLGGPVAGLALVGDGSAGYAVVRVSGKKGILKSVELVRIDLHTARASSLATLPVTAAGLAVAPNGGTLLVACKDEVRTFSIPAVVSGRLYRVAGDNLGVSPVPDSTYAIVAQSARVVLVDLSAPQGRDGLEVKDETPAPAPLTGLLASAGEGGPVALAEGGRAWRIRVSGLPTVPVAPVAPVVPDPPPPQEPPPPSPPPAAEAQEEPAPRAISGDPGTVSGLLTGPAAADVAAVVFLGPGNILREAARVAPDRSGRYSAARLAAGAYRIVAAGKEGRVLICRPPYISLRVGSNSAVEAEELAVLRAQ